MFEISVSNTAIVIKTRVFVTDHCHSYTIFHVTSSYIILKNSSSSILSKYEVEEQHWSEEEFEDTKGVIRIRKLKKDRQHKTKRKGTKGQTTIYKTYT